MAKKMSRQKREKIAAALQDDLMAELGKGRHGKWILPVNNLSPEQVAKNREVTNRYLNAMRDLNAATARLNGMIQYAGRTR